MYKKIFSFWFPVLVWAGVIFGFSSMPVTPTKEFYLWDFILKKTAHLSEYFIFYLLLYRAIKNTTTFPSKKTMIICWLLLVLYAISDEFHQLFTPGRTSTLRDVIIDGIGGLISIWFIKQKLPKAPEKLKNWAKNWQIL